MNNIDKELYYDLMSKINIMKPATIDPDNTKEVLKLEAILDSDDYDAERNMMDLITSWQDVYLCQKTTKIKLIIFHISETSS